MNCKKCGAPLTLTQKFCDNCGAPNEEASKHIEDMERYGRTFYKTKQEVENNSKWFFEYIVPITVLVIALVASAFFMYASNSLLAYKIADNKSRNYVKDNEEEVQAELREMLKNGEYQEVLRASYHDRRLKNDDEYSSWSGFYEVAEDYYLIRDSVISYCDDNVNDTYLKDDAISSITESIIDMYHYTTYNNCEESKEYINDLINNAESILKVYCNLTDEQISRITQMDKTSVLALITGGMSIEKQK